MGSFLVDYNSSHRDYVHKVINLQTELNHIVDVDMPLLQFFDMVRRVDFSCSVPKINRSSLHLVETNVFGNSYFSFNCMLELYLNYYYIYRMILDANNAKRLFLRFKRRASSKIMDFVTCIPLEYLNQKEFCYYSYMNKDYAVMLKNIYKNYYSFDENINLVFSIIIYNHDLEMIDYIKNHFLEFKKFILEETSGSVFSGVYAKKAYNFLKETELIKLFSEEDFLILYKKNPDIYYDLDEVIFLDVACKINNMSPEILLERNNSTKLYIQYRDYDLYNGVPVLKYVRDGNQTGNQDFISYFFENNSVIVKLYKKYYKSYQRNIIQCP